MPPTLANLVTSPYPQPIQPGAVISTAGFINMYQCKCTGTGVAPTVTPTLGMTCTGGSSSKKNTKWIVAVVRRLVICTFRCSQCIHGGASVAVCWQRSGVSGSGLADIIVAVWPCAGGSMMGGVTGVASCAQAMVLRPQTPQLFHAPATMPMPNGICSPWLWPTPSCSVWCLPRSLWLSCLSFWWRLASLCLSSMCISLFSRGMLAAGGPQRSMRRRLLGIEHVLFLLCLPAVKWDACVWYYSCSSNGVVDSLSGTRPGCMH